MRKQSIAATMILAGALIIGTMALAQNQGPGGGGPGQGMGGNPMANMTPQQQEQMRQNMMMRMCPVQMFPALPQQTIEAITPTLKLTAAQQVKADQLFTALTAQIQSLRKNPKINQELQDEMKRSDTDPAKVQELAMIAMAQETAVLKAELTTWMEFKKLLTAEQQTALWTMMSSQQGGMRRRGGFGRGGGNRQGGMGRQSGNQQSNDAPPAPQDNPNPGY